MHDYVLALIKRRASNAGPSAGSSAAGVAPGTEAQAVPELTVCETGFNGGHSAVMFVEAALEAADEVLARGSAQTGGTHAGLRTLGFQYVVRALLIGATIRRGNLANVDDVHCYM